MLTSYPQVRAGGATAARFASVTAGKQTDDEQTIQIRPPARALRPCARERRRGSMVLLPSTGGMWSPQLSAQFGGHGQGFAARLERALAGDDAGLLFELQVSALEELDCAPTDTLAGGGARLDGWCQASAQEALSSPQVTAVAVFAAQAANFSHFRRLLAVQGAALPLSAALGHSQGLANAVLASAGGGECTFTALAR